MKIISLDCESNGLGGRTFAAAAVFTDDDGRDLDVWAARCPIDQPVNEWVATHVLPPLASMTTNAIDYGDLLDRWTSRWRHWRTFYPDAMLVTHIPWPVEAGFLRDAHADDLFAGPYPVVDVAPLLLAAGHDPTSVDGYLAAHGLPAPDGSPHHPLYDARAAERAFRHLIDARGKAQR
jgi:hypothetical protein